MQARQPHPLMRDRAAGLLPEVARRLDEAVAAVAREDLAVARAALADVLAQAPGCLEARRLSGLVQQLRGNHVQAVAMLREVLALNPRDALVHMNLGISLYMHGDFDEALSSLRRACDLASDFAPAWFNFGRVLHLRGRSAGAVTALHRALDIEPEHLPARIALANAQARLGVMDQARANYREVLRIRADHPQAWIGLARLEGEHFDKDDVARLRQALQTSWLTPDARMTLGFALARALEDQAHYHAAFKALRKANALRRRQLGWDAAAARRKVGALLAAFAQPLAGAPQATLGEQMVFVVSMPQGGTDAVAQVLATHAQAGHVENAPDLQQVVDAESLRRGQPFPEWLATTTPADWARLGQDYLERFARYGRGQPCVLDINPLNWPLVGVLMAMLPGARVVNSRRDMLESCLACYRRLFVRGHGFSYDLDDIVSYWRDYDRLSRHWLRLFPGRFLELDHAALLADPPTRVRELLAFCGLDDDPACLALPRFRQAEGTDTPLATRYGNDVNQLRTLLGLA